MLGLVWRKSTGAPLHNALVWMDTRTEDICHKLTAVGGKDRLRARTGLPIVPYFSATKLKWLMENEPKVMEAGELVKCCCVGILAKRGSGVFVFGPQVFIGCSEGCFCW